MKSKVEVVDRNVIGMPLYWFFNRETRYYPFIVYCKQLKENTFPQSVRWRSPASSFNTSEVWSQKSAARTRGAPSCFPLLGHRYNVEQAHIASGKVFLLS